MESSDSKKVGNFVIEEELVEGGMGVVFLGRQPTLDRPVVLKRLRQVLAGNPELLERFEREARAAASVHHQNVVVVYDCFAWRGAHYIAQEYVDGADLKTILSRSRAVPPRIAALIALEMIRGLEAIHAAGIVHRDLKPANILIGRGGETKIADFGIVLDRGSQALTQPGIMLGSPPYMSPEQILGDRPDYRSDLFSFGVVVYEMLTGVLPFPEGESGESLYRRIQRGRYVSPRRLALRVPRSLARLIRACLSPKPERRVQSATVIRRALERRVSSVSPSDCRGEIGAWLGAAGVLQPCDGDTRVLASRVGTPARRRPRLLAISATACGALLATVLVVHAVPMPRAESEDPLDGWLPGWFSLPGFRHAPLASLEFQIDPATVVSLDGDELDTFRSGEPLILRAGSHTLVFKHPRFGRIERKLELEEGEHRVQRDPHKPGTEQ
jgi:serine/threonine-protein kinase